MSRIAIIDTSRNALRQRAAANPANQKFLEQNALISEAMENRRRQMAIDLVNQGKPLPTSLTHTPHYLLEPGVTYKEQWMPNKKSNIVLPNGLPDGKAVSFVGLAKTPMGDWDWPDSIHHGSSVTINHLGDVVDRLARHTTDNPGSRWEMYLTPGGVRAWEVTKSMSPREFADKGRFEELGIDPNYAKLSVRQQTYADPKLKYLYPEEQFNVRVSSKPGRSEDFVAYHLGHIGDGLPHPTAQRLVSEYHDQPIMRSMLRDGLTPGTLPSSGIDLLNKHLETVEPRFAKPIAQRMQALGVYGEGY